MIHKKVNKKSNLSHFMKSCVILLAETVILSDFCNDIAYIGEL